jgi:DNA-directed RNA polymerase subunit alpha
MEPIHLPSKIEIKPGKEPFTAEFILEPCHQGYGITIGNALRRVLLSSIPGGAVTAVKIKGVDHEFSTIPNIKEDVIQIILNLKQLRVKLHASEPVRLHLQAKGEKIVTARDIEPNPLVEIINPDLVIAELTSKDAELEMDIFVEEGRGYLTLEEKPKRNLEIGVIAVDSIFTPIRNVGFRVEPVRVGQITNFDRLIMNIETDGSITPEDALKQAAKILIDHFRLIESFSSEINSSKNSEEEIKEIEKAQEISETSEDKEPQETKEKEKKKSLKRNKNN